ncbi:helix-turn-helix transcriptional regulator [Mycolicibacterium sp. F2034L]|uniref:helix-turn-helix transcriptional regulator n=1 Tax=Mycolicibacterium sp. F2034L TaxID=2926422 RepID=UPI001FF136A3|nr:helix-turn-helix transcriptional regulator [Mycolicibacterium sp. F2034L]MCK0175838.1 helix-turn-helix domain-containing protein [Mycolicibacterium sp. F2034L]
MGKQSLVETRFRERVRRERERRDWSQAELAKLLQDRGIGSAYPTTVAKIEAGERAVRIDEATALADIFDVSVDALLGRSSSFERDRLYAVRDAALQATSGVSAISTTLINVFAELDGLDFDNREAVTVAAGRALAALRTAVDELMVVTSQPTIDEIAEAIMQPPQPQPRKRSERRTL